MIFLAVQESGTVTEPLGFNCGDSNLQRAQWIAEDLRSSLQGDLKVNGPEMTNGDDFIITVTCRKGSLSSVTMLIETSVEIWRIRGRLG